MFLKKEGNKHSSIRHFIPLVVALVVAMVAGVAVYASQIKEVEINQDGKILSVKTMGKTVEDVLSENEIYLEKDDKVVPQQSSLLKAKNRIDITKPEVKIVKENKKKVNLKIVKKDDVKSVAVKIPEQNNAVTEKEKTTEKIVTVKAKIPFKVSTKANDKLLRGETKVVQKGKEGIVEKKYKVVMKNGKEVSRTLMSKNIIQQPTEKIVEEGNVRVLVTSRGDTLRLKRVITMKSTAYCNGLAETGKAPGSPGYGITATGMKTKKGVVAVDPRVIPLGSRLYIEGLNSSAGNYGYAVAADTGGAIKGNKIDVFLPTSKEVKNWGVRKVKVYVLE